MKTIQKDSSSGLLYPITISALLVGIKLIGWPTIPWIVALLPILLLICVIVIGAACTED